MPTKRVTPFWQKPITNFFISQSPWSPSPNQNVIVGSGNDNSATYGHPSKCPNEVSRSTGNDDKKESGKVGHVDVTGDTIEGSMNGPQKSTCSVENSDFCASTEHFVKDESPNDNEKEVANEIDEKRSQFAKVTETDNEGTDSAKDEEDINSVDENSKPVTSDRDDSKTSEIRKEGIEANSPVFHETNDGQKENSAAKKKVQKKTSKRPILRVMIGAKHRRLKITTRNEVAGKN